MAKSLLRIEAQNLRKQGIGIKTIAHKLKLSSSTVSLWCRDIELTPQQLKRLQKNARDPFFGKRLEYIQKKQKSRLEKIRSLKENGIKDIGVLSDRDLFISGINLYWAEGFKKDNLVGFANTDVEMLRLFLRWIDVCCGVTKDRIKIRLGINEQYVNQSKIYEMFWSKKLNIPMQQFQKIYVQKVKWKKIYDHPEEYHGVVRIRITKSTDLLRKIIGWIEGIRLNDA
jgi:DNA-binding Lrp family transcriptional regulator